MKIKFEIHQLRPSPGPSRDLNFVILRNRLLAQFPDLRVEMPLGTRGIQAFNQEWSERGVTEGVCETQSPWPSNAGTEEQEEGASSFFP